MPPPEVELQIRRMLGGITHSPAPLDAPANASLDDVGVDSAGMIHLIYELEECFGVQIADEEVTPDNFESIASLVAMVNRKCSN